MGERESKPPDRLIANPEFGTNMLSHAETNYYAALMELNCRVHNIQHDIGTETTAVGNTMGTNSTTTVDIQLITYEEAIQAPDKAKWLQAIAEEYKCQIESNMIKLVHVKDLPDNATVITTRWTNKKPNGAYRSRITGRGLEMIEGEHYDEDSIAAPTVNIITVRVMLVIMLIMFG